MSDHQYKVALKGIMLQLETAKRLGCKRVIADCQKRIEKLQLKLLQPSFLSETNKYENNCRVGKAIRQQQEQN